MSYSFQTFSVGQVLTAAQMNQVEVNIRDHIHGQGNVVPGPGWTLIETKQASAASNIDFETGLDDTSYDRFMISYESVVPATDDSALYARLKCSGSYQTTGYQYSARMSGIGGGADMGSTTDALTAAVPLSRPGAGQGVGSASGEHVQGMVEFANPETAIFPLLLHRSAYIRSDGAPCAVNGTGNYATAVAMTGIRFLFSAGNITSGTFRLYGLRKSTS